jgi:trehalose 6-phosphate synthase/phosphatase
VSNHLPVTIHADGPEVRVEPSAGGLASGLRGLHDASGGVWIGWSGTADDLDAAQATTIEDRLRALRVVAVPLPVDEIRGYYEGVAREVLWPLFHSLAGLMPLRLPDFSVYQHVNERFAAAAVAEYGLGDTIWVHDYHLLLVPGLIRRALPEAPIGFFLHIPFPPAEVFRGLPFRDELLAGVLGADLVGFHAPAYLRQFASTVMRLRRAPSGIDGVAWEGRCGSGCFPWRSTPGPSPKPRKSRRPSPGRPRCADRSRPSA